MNKSIAYGATGAFLLGSFIGCAASSDVRTSFGATSSAGGAFNVPGSGAAPAAGAATSFGGSQAGDPVFTPFGGMGNDRSPDASCAATTAAAERVTTTMTTEVKMPAPVAVYIMQDQSLSMLGPKWTSVQQAIQTFVTSPMSAGMDVGIKFFAAGNLLDCTGADYVTPDVPVAALPMNAQPIIDSTNMHGPSTLTPIEPALRGGINYCLQFQAMNPMEKCVNVFITDGVPDLCDGVVQDLANIAADGKAKGVLTFSVGMDGADFNMLSAIAQAGGTDCTPMTTAPGDEACDVRAGTQAFVDALNTIRGTISTFKTTTQVKTTALQCEFAIPKPPDGEKFDRDKVNVRLTTQGGPMNFGHVPTAADCAQVGNQGWYYDDQNNPTKIEVCSGTCAAIKASTGGDGGVVVDPMTPAPRVDVLLGCKTVEGIR